MSDALQFLPLRRPDPHPIRSKLALAGGLFAVFVIAAVIGGGFWVQSYEGRIAPNVWIGTIPVGGLTPESAKLVVQKAADGLFDRGLSVTLNGGHPSTLTLGALVGGDFVEDASLDIDQAVADAASIGHKKNDWQAAQELLRSLSERQTIAVPVTIQESGIRSSLANLYPREEQATENARLVFRFKNGAWTATATEGKPGKSFDVPQLLTDVSGRLSSLSSDPIDIRLNTMEPIADKRVAELAKPAALAVLNQAPFTLVAGTGEQARPFEITASLLAQALGPGEDGSLLLNREPIKQALQLFVAPLEVASKNARFSVTDGRVTQFEPSETGVKADVETALDTLQHLVAHSTTLAPEEKTIPLALMVVQPEISTDKANDLGIVTLLGTGTSSYDKSPANRIKNIENGVKLLNGRLIPPGTTFSAVAALQPFTIENGYLPELVIKGDKIVPELGGGLCQIGTTTFRAAMNAGFPIAERHNHSLVVTYYNDPSNNNPGTDASLYNPAPDLKFVNDTGKYILFQAEMVPEEKTLRFTFWGTSDGRKGSYTPPVVDRWVPAGEAQDIPSPDLKPGKRTCQAAHPGADTSFTYTIERADGSTATQVFASHYRALPKICLVGQNTKTPALATSLSPTTIPAIPD